MRLLPKGVQELHSLAVAAGFLTVGCGFFATLGLGNAAGNIGHRTLDTDCAVRLTV